MDNNPPVPASTSTSARGKDQIHWASGVWHALDRATEHELRISRVAAKFLPHVYVEKKDTTIAADQVNVPPLVARAMGAPPPDALNIDESLTTRINEYWIQFRLSPAQVEAESHVHSEAARAAGPNGTHADGAHSSGEPASGASHESNPHTQGMGGGGPTGSHEHMMHAHHEASSGISLTTRAANMLALSEDLILFNGANAIANSPLFTSGTVTALDPNIANNLDLGLLNIAANGRVGPNLRQPPQVIRVSPVQIVPAAGAVPAQYYYRENTLNAVARGVAVLQSLGHYEHYALVLNTVPYADLHQALPNTLITPIEPISHLIKAGVYGTGALPPFDGGQAGLPNVSDPNCLYTGVLVSLSGNTMDHVRGKMDGHKDAVVSFNQKDLNELYRFRIAERFALRLKDPTAVILLLFMNQ